MTTLTEREAHLIDAALQNLIHVALTESNAPLADVNELRTLRDRMDEFVIQVGDYVRSHDFADRIGDPTRKPCYVEGIVESIGRHPANPSCDTYKIKMQLRVWAGALDDSDGLIGKHAYPPVNGTPSTFGGPTRYVELVKKGGS